jgi:VIT1/CCC1 family predicted Fe2+/Mn2+ transporter
MPQPHHFESHFTAKELVRDVVIGMADGLTVPFALAAGLSGAVVVSKLIVTAGVAEIAAGAIAMGLGGYLAAKSDRDHYLSELNRERQEIIERPEDEKREVEEIFQAYGVEKEQIDIILKAFQASPKKWVNFMMRFELGIEEPDPKRALASAVTIALSYVVGGLIPLAPYMMQVNASIALNYSIAFTIIALIIFGYIKGRFTGVAPITSAMQTVLIGGLAAGVAFVIARIVSGAA